jgi:hypothetical protein
MTYRQQNDIIIKPKSAIYREASSARGLSWSIKSEQLPAALTDLKRDCAWFWEMLGWLEGEPARDASTETKWMWNVPGCVGADGKSSETVVETNRIANFRGRRAINNTRSLAPHLEHCIHVLEYGHVVVCIDRAEWTPPFSEATLTLASLSPEEAQVDFCQYAEDSFTVL